jgi:adenine phosphoribosyltransferase
MNLLDYLPVVPDFPKPGIMFRDISPLLANPQAFQEAIKQLAILTHNVEYTHILGVESRGFIFGAALANHLAKPLVLARKPNKLPLEVHQESYGLEYGQDLLEMQKKIIPEGAKVLIVDDDPINLQVLNNYLGLCNYEITQASSGQEALTLLSQGYHPDLVILDVMMPKMTGYEVTRAIRAKWKRDELPIVLLTAKDRLDDELVGLQAGANDYLTKPIVKEGLIARIRTQLSLRQESKDRQQAQFENVRVAQELKETNLAPRPYSQP